jgi:hypothetical protein
VKPNWSLYVPLGAAGLTLTALLMLAAHKHGKRAERRRAWLIDRRTQ